MSCVLYSLCDCVNFDQMWKWSERWNTEWMWNFVLNWRNYQVNHRVLKTLYGESTMSKVSVLSGTNISVKSRCEQQKARCFHNETNGQKCHENRKLVQSDGQWTCRKIAGECDMDKDKTILVQDLGMRKLAANIMPWNLVEEQRTDISLCAWL
jgi:hypothetical protein